MPARNSGKKLSIVVPCYNEQESILVFYTKLDRFLKKKVFNRTAMEFIFINDGSEDNSLDIIREIAGTDRRVKYISFSRNFGKESAIYAGLEKSSGYYTAIMDVDLQDPIELLEEMFVLLDDDKTDCVAARRISRRGEPFFRSVLASLFYTIINKISRLKIAAGARDFRIMKRPMVDAILSLPEYNRFSKGLFSWIGFSVKWISYENVGRQKGNSKWSFRDLIFYSIDGIAAFSEVPLAFAAFMGIGMSFLAVGGIIFIVIRKILFGDPVSGWPSLAVIICFSGGLQLLCLGIIGQYLAKTYLETKKRPKYLIKEQNY
ncbi:MAG: hypothetical protein A2096_02745 [Spirochaetes bacterium GWF1_41_5]|nr:MAG: hypothetical protein A2096_02745 [Spirochaetes bacterium GWF1_41_5]